MGITNFINIVSDFETIILNLFVSFCLFLSVHLFDRVSSVCALDLVELFETILGDDAFFVILATISLFLIVCGVSPFAHWVSSGENRASLA